MANRWLRLLCAAAGACAISAAVKAQETYPARPVRMIVGFAAGGPTDVLARVMANWLSARLGQNFIVDNRTGAGGNIATEAVIKAPADGYTVLVIVTAYVINPALYPNLPFDFMRDITGVAGLARISYVVGVWPGLPVRNISELAAWSKANPGKVAFASGGVGSSSHLSTEILKSMTGADFTHVPYKGNAAAYADLISGRIQMILADRLSLVQHLNTGAVRGIGVTSTSRFSAMPDLPAIAESVPGYEASAFYGFGVPRGTPQAVIDRLNEAVNAGHRDAATRARFTELDAEPIVMNAPDWQGFMVREADRWARAIKSAGVKPE